MKRLIGEICDRNENGFQLISQPTGSGKTFSINCFIHEYFITGNLNEKRNIVVVTTNKNNLAFRELKAMFEATGHLAIFDSIYLYLDSITNLVLDGYHESMDDRIVESLGQNPTVTYFLTAIKNILRSTDDSGKESPAVKEAKQHFGKDIEPKFRSLLKKKIRSERHGYNERLELIENDHKWNWVTKLYPQIYSRKRKLFFMSADKFVMRNDTLIDQSNTVYESMIVNNAIVFIDEFDSTKNQILSRLVEETIKNPVDYLDMFQKMYQGGTDLYIDPKFYKPHESFDSDLKEQHDRKMKLLCKVRKQYHLESPVVLGPDIDISKAFLFRADIMFLVSGKFRSMEIRYDKKTRTNVISMSSNKKDNKKFYEMFRQIDYAIEDYCRLIRSLAYNYYKKENDGTLSYEDCIYVILDLYGISQAMPSYRNYLHKRVLLGAKSPKRFVGADSSVYENGFEYLAFMDDTISKERAHIQLISCRVSAEKVLLKVCERALVFGVSATAEFKTVLGNYDLGYIKSRLGDKYLLTIKDNSILREQIVKAYGNYDSQNITWDIQSVPSGIDGKWDDSMWDDLFASKKHSSYVKDRVNGVNEYYLMRYYHLAYALKALIRSKTKRNGLFFCNMHPVDRSPVFDSNIVRTMFEILVKEAMDESPGVPEIKISFLKKDDFDSCKRSIQADMANGIRAAIITSYGTFSTGQNMQFDIPDGVDARNVSLLDPRKEMDVDFIYLQTPTHLIHSPEAEEYEKERILHLCDIHFLKSNGEITQKECIEAVSAALSGNSIDINTTVGRANQSRSGHMHAAIKLTQAIGRICRTNMKNPEISIYYDEEIRGYIDQPLGSYGLVSPETMHFYEHCLKDRESPPDIARLEELAVFRSHNANNLIHEVLGWHDKSTIDNYNAMRLDLLCNPSMNELNNTAYQMYVELPEPADHYWCDYEKEYRNLKISFDRPLRKGSKIDTEGLRFNDLFTIPGLKKHFESNGYATELKVGKYLVSPVAAKNILMGMHGEVAGCYIIDPDNKILKPMELVDFEKFDFQINERVAVDFKHWSSDIFALTVEQHKHIIDKMKDTGHSVVYVVNILLPVGQTHKNMIYEKDGKKIIKVPWLFDPATGQFNNKMIAEIRGIGYDKEYKA